MMMLEKLLQPYQAMLPKSSSSEAPTTYVSKLLNVDLENDFYLKLLPHGGLFVPSRQLAHFGCGCFAILDFLEKEIVLLGNPVAKVVTYILKRCGSFPHFSCNMHHDWIFKFASKIVVNIFFNNKQKK